MAKQITPPKPRGERVKINADIDKEALQIFDSYAKAYNVGRSQWLRNAIDLYNEHCKTWKEGKKC